MSYKKTLNNIQDGNYTIDEHNNVNQASMSFICRQKYMKNYIIGGNNA